MPKGSPRPTAGAKVKSPSGKKGRTEYFYLYEGERAILEECLEHHRRTEREAIANGKNQD